MYLLNISCKYLSCFNLVYSGAHIQNIERVWREVRANVPRYGTRNAHLIGYLAEYLFKRIHKFEDRISGFFRAIAELYPPKIFEEDIAEAANDN